MQPPDISPSLEDSNSDLHLPRLPYENIDHLIASSRHLQRATSSRTMSSLADDSSLDESVSSIGPEGWEAVETIHTDDDSDYPEETISRIATPSVADDHAAESALLTPPESIREANQSQEPDQVEEKDGTLEVLQDGDVSLLWEKEQITFSEVTDARGLAKQQDVTCPLADISGQTAQTYVEGSSWSELQSVAGSLRMKLGSRPLSLSRPLRLLFVGSEECQNEIEAKIGSALVAGLDDRLPRRRRRSIMPISLGRESPEVELIPESGANMEIDTCVNAVHSHDHSESIKLTMDSGTVFTSKFDHESKGYFVDRTDELPDLAIIHVPEDEEQERSLRLRARSFLIRHTIPTLIISSNKNWQAPSRPLTIDTRTPHFVVHVPGASVSESAVLKRLPVDIDTFLQLNSLQLNRSLCCMLADKLVKPEMIKVCSKASSHLTVLSKTLHLFAVLAIVVVVPLFLNRLVPDLVSQNTGIALNDSSVYKSAAIIKTTGQIKTTSGVATTTSPCNSLSVTETRNKYSGLTPWSKEAVQEKFHVEVLGDNSVVVKPPTWYSQQKKAPKLQFTVRRKETEETLEHEVTQSKSMKVFVLSIPWTSAYGEVDIRVSASNGRNVNINETTTVDFGRFYWKMLFGQSNPTEDTKAEPEEPNKDTLNRENSRANPISDKSNLHKDRLAEDVRFMAAEAARIGATMKKTITDGLVSLHDQRQNIRKWKRQSRILKMDDVSQQVSKQVNKLTKEVKEFRRTHFREQQKDLLKLWWKVSGGPGGDGREQKSARSDSGRKSKSFGWI